MTDSRRRRRWIVLLLLLSGVGWLIAARRAEQTQSDPWPVRPPAPRVLGDRAPAEAAPVLSAVPQPVVPQPVVPQPVVPQPVVPQPVVTQPVVTQPVVTQPVVTQPVVAQPVVARPVVAEPVGADQPAATVADRPTSAPALPDGSAPDLEFTIKGNASSMLFHPPTSPYYARTKAEIWFRTAEAAEAAGFTAWQPRPRAR